MRDWELKQNRRLLENAADMAEAYALATGWNAP